MTATGTVTLTLRGITRAQWDAFIVALNTFVTNHPEISISDKQLHEVD